MIPRFIPFHMYGDTSLRIANKTGSLPGIRADIALLETRAAAMALVFMTADSADTGFSFNNEGEVCIGTLALLVYEGWANG